MATDIWFDMDGTIADLYGVDNWLDKLIMCDTSPYMEAKPLINLSALARILNRLQRNGYTVNIVSWLSKNGTADYNAAVTKTKLDWIHKHLPSVSFDTIDIIPYGVPKEIGRNGILFDDEVNNRNNWNGIAYDVNTIIETLKSL